MKIITAISVLLFFYSLLISSSFAEEIKNDRDENSLEDYIIPI